MRSADRSQSFEEVVLVGVLHLSDQHHRWRVKGSHNHQRYWFQSIQEVLKPHKIEISAKGEVYIRRKNRVTDESACMRY